MLDRIEAPPPGYSALEHWVHGTVATPRSGMENVPTTLMRSAMRGSGRNSENQAGSQVAVMRASGSRLPFQTGMGGVIVMSGFRSAKFTPTNPTSFPPKVIEVPV